MNEPISRIFKFLPDPTESFHRLSTIMEWSDIISQRVSLVSYWIFIWNLKIIVEETNIAHLKYCILFLQNRMILLGPVIGFLMDPFFLHNWNAGRIDLGIFWFCRNFILRFDEKYWSNRKLLNRKCWTLIHCI